MNPLISSLTDCVHQLARTAGQRAGDEGLVRLEELVRGQDLTGQGMGWLTLLGRASITRTKNQMAGLPSEPGDSDLHQEPESRLPTLAQAACVLIEHGVDPIPEMGTIFQHAHVSWTGALIACVVATEKAGKPYRSAQGDTLLHRLAAEGLDMTRQRDYDWPEGWVNLGRSCDGATPLHLVWSLTEGAPWRTLRTANTNDSMRWMAYEYQEAAIFMSRYLVEEKGARWVEYPVHRSLSGVHP